MIISLPGNGHDAELHVGIKVLIPNAEAIFLQYSGSLFRRKLQKVETMKTNNPKYPLLSRREALLWGTSTGALILAAQVLPGQSSPGKQPA